MWFKGWKGYRQHPYATPPAGVSKHEEVEGCHRSSSVPLAKRRAHQQAWEKVEVACPYCGLSNIPGILSQDGQEWLTPDNSWQGKPVKQWFSYAESMRAFGL